MSYFVVDLKTKNKELHTDDMVCKTSPCQTTPTPNKFSSCLDSLNNGFSKSGKYDIKPFLNISRAVYCDQDTEGGEWTVFLRNSHGSVTFNKNWA